MWSANNNKSFIKGKLNFFVLRSSMRQERAQQNQSHPKVDHHIGEIEDREVESTVPVDIIDHTAVDESIEQVAHAAGEDQTDLERIPLKEVASVEQIYEDAADQHRLQIFQPNSQEGEHRKGDPPVEGKGKRDTGGIVFVPAQKEVFDRLIDRKNARERHRKKKQFFNH